MEWVQPAVQSKNTVTVQTHLWMRQLHPGGGFHGVGPARGTKQEHGYRADSPLDAPVAPWWRISWSGSSPRYKARTRLPCRLTFGCASCTLVEDFMEWVQPAVQSKNTVTVQTHLWMR